MPKIPAKRKVSKSLSWDQLDWLATGVPLDGPEMRECADGAVRPFDSEEEAAAAWRANKQAVRDFRATYHRGCAGLAWAEEVWGDG